MLALYPKIEETLQTGGDYAIWDNERRFRYIVDIATQIGQIPKFAFATKTPQKVGWQDILRWWLDPSWGYEDDCTPRTGFVAPKPELTFKWYEYVHHNFIYRLNWGIGSCISTAFGQAYDGERKIPNVDNWPDSDLPWAVFWLKELITWGTLDPVAAYLLARVKSESIVTRRQAKHRAKAYYESCFSDLSANEWLDAESVRRWVSENVTNQATLPPQRRPPPIPVTLLRDFSAAPQPTFRVLPAEKDRKILWLDAAGFLLAESERPENWTDDWISSQDFFLNYAQQRVRGQSYL